VRAWGDENRPQFIGGADGSAPANPSPREQVRSRPTVGFVRGHRQRTQGRCKDLPAITTRQRSARASCYAVRSQIWAARPRHLFSAASMPAFSVASRPPNS
jgi:hypothetical protein